MQPAAPAPKVSLLRFFIEAAGPSGFLLIAISIGLIVWGLINLAFVKNRYALAIQAILSLSPAILSCFFLTQILLYILGQTGNAGPMDQSQIPQFVATALIGGIIGSAATVLPAFLGILALARNVGARPTSFDQRPG
jgi:hypothetical protein